MARIFIFLALCFVVADCKVFERLKRTISQADWIQCSDDLHDCREPLMAYGRRLDSFQGTKSLVSSTSELSKFCDDLTTFQGCRNKAYERDACTVYAENFYESDYAIDALAEYVCQEQSRVLIQAAATTSPCFANETAVQGALMSLIPCVMGIERAFVQASGNLAAICPSILEARNCAANIIGDRCGQDMLAAIEDLAIFLVQSDVPQVILAELGPIDLSCLPESAAQPARRSVESFNVFKLLSASRIL